MSQVRVDIVEHERGLGSRVMYSKYFDTLSDAIDFADEFDRTAPDDWEYCVKAVVDYGREI